ncbi:hypothetical protein BJ875DRAFT_439784 [Amylocarpus encephaloides]|uniref:Uncharacterized protein n=1 Tax=Amylocarpus encephaloides TaxID=45428 RepID=A0A9P7YLP5_9HELO|nr:hypothetical protein BJ875DRAFT_439784 [Amylocarpus encephaloides]
MVRSHPQVCHFYKDAIKGTGKMGLKLNDNFRVPKNPNNQSDVDAVNHFNDFQLATFSAPSSFVSTTLGFSRRISETIFASPGHRIYPSYKRGGFKQSSGTIVNEPFLVVSLARLGSRFGLHQQPR